MGRGEMVILDVGSDERVELWGDGGGGSIPAKDPILRAPKGGFKLFLAAE